MYSRPRPLFARANAERAQPTAIITPDPNTPWERWTPGALGDDKPKDSAATVPEAAPVDPEVLRQEQQQRELVALREAARAEGYQAGLEKGQADGHQEGLERGMAEGLRAAQEHAQVVLAEKLALLDAMINQSQGELSHLQETVGQSLVHLGVRVAEHVLGHALAQPAPSVLAVVREVLQDYDRQDEHLTFLLHAEDLQAIESSVAAMPTLARVRLLADPQLGRGDVRVKTAYGEIDASVQTRWDAALAAIGYERPLLRDATSTTLAGVSEDAS